MVLVESHESRTSAWWQVTTGVWRGSLSSGRIAVVDDSDPYALTHANLNASQWPVLREAIDALYQVWLEQQEEEL